MANPRRTSYINPNQLPISEPFPQFQSQTPHTAATILNSLKIFLKKPHAFPFLLSIFLLLTWISLRFQRRDSNPYLRQSSYSMDDKNGGFLKDSNANVVKFSSFSSLVMKDKRGWLIDPVSLAMDAGVPGGAASCASLHVGEIRPRGMRGNHRHHTCNETFVIWGAKTVFRLENKAVEKGYSEVTIGADEVAVAVSPSGTAHALLNIDAIRSTYLIGCQDSVLNYNASTSDFNVWKDV
ncbi:hypothetical protein BUALT_Bualt16G0105800 [Buddleja alternifolia]|uniref:Uncharacterized protein n=1 Tax=Buddleja alternifolia TaxID=168488 RepID=A0AAV6WL88_9LAMI|nr:hypothetical protein BUALT_Bualt16G0105800 [Buddleja alternifolia]